MKPDFDLIVIGTGTGGNGVARMAANAGLKTASVDMLPYGGTCALRGCDPKKMLIAVTEAADWVSNMADKGLQVGELSTDWPTMIQFKRTFTDTMPTRVEAGLGEAGITTLHGAVRFTGLDKVQIEEIEYRARMFHIATGARPATLGISGEEYLITSTDFLEMPAIPRRIAFIGGGFIAMEFSHISKRSGAAEVSVLQRSPQPLKNFDPDMVRILMNATDDLGVDLRCNAAVSEIVKAADGSLVISFHTPEGIQSIICDVAVHAGGRVPNIDDLGLERLGVKYDRRGIKVTKHMRSPSNPSVFAAGDCADSGPNLTPVAANEARVAGKNIVAGADLREINYPPIPSVVFTLPPLASVGLSEAEARMQGLEFDVHMMNTEGWYSSMRVGAQHTGFKTLVETGSGKIIGAHIVGPGAEEQINVIATAMAAGLTANQVKALIFAYPSYASDIGSMV